MRRTKKQQVFENRREGLIRDQFKIVTEQKTYVSQQEESVMSQGEEQSSGENLRKDGETSIICFGVRILFQLKPVRQAALYR